MDKKLQEYLKTLSVDRLLKISHEIITRMIETEEINYYEDSEAPYWDCTGQALHEDE